MLKNSISTHIENVADSLTVYYENSIVDKWINSLDVGGNTKEAYRYHLEQFKGWLKSNNIENVSKVEIINYKKYLISHYSSATVCLKISSLKSFYGYLECEHICSDITKNVKGAKISKGFKKDIFTMEQLKDILNSIDTSTLLGMRDFALINVLLRTGMRGCELQRANIADIRNKDGEIVLYIQGKGRDSKDNFVVLTPTLLNILDKYFKMREEKQHITDTSPLFISLADNNFGNRLSLFSIRWIVKCILRNAGIDSTRLTTHSYRHTAITLSLLGGAELLDVKEFARHENINTTFLYIHNVNRLANAPEKKLDTILEECKTAI